MRNFLYRLMMGRYGSDRLNKHLLVLSVVLTLCNIFVQSVVIYILVYILLLYVLFRMLSKNINKRYQENQKYEQLIAPLLKRITLFKKSSQDKDHKYFICPNCKQIVRVPKGKGRIDIRCPRCATVFEKENLVMFGYIQYNKEALSEEEYAIYRSYYCGLCKSIKQLYGIKMTRILSNDLTFIQILLSALNEPDEVIHEEKCAVHYMRKITSRTNCYDDYVAKMNVVLAYFKAVDDVRDEGRNKGMLKTLKQPFLNIKEEYPHKIASIEKALDAIHQLEDEKCENLDLLCNTFGQVMGEIVSFDAIFGEELYQLGYHLGKFIYLMDAYDDIEEDIKKATFNPLKERYHDAHFDDDMKMMLEVFMGDASLAFERLPIITHGQILRNILYSGVWAKYNQVREKRGEKKNESL